LNEKNELKIFLPFYLFFSFRSLSAWN